MDYNKFLQSRDTTSIPRRNEENYDNVRRVTFNLLKTLTTGNSRWNATYFRESLTHSERKFLKDILTNSLTYEFEWKLDNPVQQLFKVKVYEGLESKGDTLSLHNEYDVNFPRRTNFLGKFKYDDMKSYLDRWHGKNKYTVKVYSASENGWKLEFSFE